LQRRLEEFGFYTEADVDAFAKVYWNKKAKQEQLHALLDPIVARSEKATEEERADFKRQLTNYVRLYAFLSQVITFTDAALEKLYVFGRLLLRKLPVTRDELPVAITQNVNMDLYRVQQTSAGKIVLESGTGELEPITELGTGRPPQDELEALSQIIHDLNERFGTEFTEADQVFFAELGTRLMSDEALAKSAQINSKDNVRLTFDHLFDDKLADMIDRNMEIYKRVVDDAEFGAFIRAKMFELIYQRFAQG
jgi:type I restriction enzyme R subunit